MLSGKAPFYTKAKTDSASSIMRRIKEGDFRLEGESWRYVSSAAKSLTKGLLTVDPRKRFSMEQLRSSPWLSGGGLNGISANMPTLLTASVLIAEPTERCLKQTYDAFHNATREGFRLTPVSSASSKLLQKRKLKQSVSSETSTSSLSDRSSFGSKSSGSSISMSNSSSKHWPDAVHQGSTNPSRSKDLEIFSFKSGHVQQYLTASSFPSSVSSTTISRTGTFTHPLTSRTPLTIPLTVQVPVTSTSYPSSHFSPFTPSPAALSFPTSPGYPPPTSSYHETGQSGVSLTLIQNDHDVINSSSVIQKTGNPAVLVALRPTEERVANSPGSAESEKGPLTRSRKRRLQDVETTIADHQPAPLDLKIAKTKIKRAGTIVIE